MGGGMARAAGEWDGEGCHCVAGALQMPPTSTTTIRG